MSYYWLTLINLLQCVYIKEMGPRGAEARDCETPSEKFQGMCFISRNCASICKEESFTGGECQGLRRKCICVKPCPNSS